MNIFMTRKAKIMKYTAFCGAKMEIVQHSSKYSVSISAD